MEDLDGHDHPGMGREEGVDREPGGMAQDADEHRDPPSQLLQHQAQDEHGQELRDLAEAHDRHCLLYTSDAADDLLCVDLGGRRIIKKNTYFQHRNNNY